MFARTFVAGWGDMDFNAHMRNTAFLDRAADVRMMFFAEHGFPVQGFADRRIGPVIMRDELEYFREVGLLEEFTISLAIAGLARDGSRFRFRNDVRNGAGTLCARVTSTGGWLDLDARKLVVPPADLLAAMGLLPRAEDFEDLRSSAKNGG